MQGIHVGALRERSVQRGKRVTMSSTVLSGADERVHFILRVEGDEG